VRQPERRPVCLERDGELTDRALPRVGGVKPREVARRDVLRRLLGRSSRSSPPQVRAAPERVAGRRAVALPGAVGRVAPFLARDPGGAERQGSSRRSSF